MPNLVMPALVIWVKPSSERLSIMPGGIVKSSRGWEAKMVGVSRKACQSVTMRGLWILVAGVRQMDASLGFIVEKVLRRT